MNAINFVLSSAVVLSEGSKIMSFNVCNRAKKVCVRCVILF